MLAGVHTQLASKPASFVWPLQFSSFCWPSQISVAGRICPSHAP